ncbi:YbaB/EbfC family nucleoid-associated protein [Catellatospora coxensis]|uniref:YbaB/EbfC DNA-binding family protein n=1 Tax=Catellatospora coxensis TaxID=310354 RepID=A0A8J3PBS5_9ACTN|nr:YbaB/EbfC family nucleoid-associated protein [Catellatospora coxensis]GIG09251.1 hypothetical protein Cco03nite_59510 [Catellatospora coxensis]
MQSERTMEQIAADFARHRAAVVESTRRMAEITATVTSSQGLVTVTVGNQGELTTLTFNSQDYRKMPPAELAQVVLDTITRARESALQQVMGLIPTTTVAGVSLQDMMQGRVDWDQVLPEEIDITGFDRPGRTV